MIDDRSPQDQAQDVNLRCHQMLNDMRFLQIGRMSNQQNLPKIFHLHIFSTGMAPIRNLSHYERKPENNHRLRLKWVLKIR